MDDLSHFAPFEDFDQAADAIMSNLHGSIGFDGWLVTRITGDDWVVLRTYGKGPYAAGQAIPFSATVCSRMLAGQGPCLTHDVARVETYEQAPERRAQRMERYAGAPITLDGAIFGVLCGFDSTIEPPVSQQVIDAQSNLLTTSARTLSTLLAHQLSAEQLVRRAERAEAEALIDDMTGLFNRRGWQRLVERESMRANRYGNQATMFVMDIDGLKVVNDTYGHAAGDMLIKRVANVIVSVMRDHDIAARLGGDEFGVLAVETSVLDAQVLNERFDAAFVNAGVRVSVGRAHCNRPGGISASLPYADELMYVNKAHRHAVDYQILPLIPGSAS